MDRTRRRSSKPPDIQMTGDDLVQYFYKCMLTYIVDHWEDDMKNPTDDYVPKSKKVYIFPNPSYVQACNESELENDAVLENVDMVETLLKCKSGSRVRGTRVNKKSKRFEKQRNRKLSSSSKKYEFLEEFFQPDLEDCVMIKFTNGNFYNGPVYKKKFHGSGKFRWSDGSTYVGEFVHGEITGKGKFCFNDESSYDGNVYKGFPHGYGKKYNPESPSAYCGHWQIGKKHGTGWVIFSEDNWYEGNFQADKMHGNGIRCYPDGSKYQGNFFEGKRQGQGCAILWNNDIYIGEWMNGRRSGHGEYIWNSFLNPDFVVPIQNKYIGHWKKDRMHGKGELHFGSKNGARYVGEFIKNVKHGCGIVICDNGEVFQCGNIFANDKPVHLQENGKVMDSLHVTETCVEHCRKVYEKLEQGANCCNGLYLGTEKKKPSHNNKKIFLLPTYGYGKETLANINLCQFKFDRHSPRRSCFRLPINSTGEHINLDSPIRKLYEMVYEYKINLKA